MNLNEKLDEISENKFFSFSRPYLNFIDKSKIYVIIYFVMAVINLILPFYHLYKLIDSGVFDYGAKYVFADILTWFVIVLPAGSDFRCGGTGERES